ncbi:MAG: methyltransferase, partial [Verrucomicrobiota bacterium]
MNPRLTAFPATDPTPVLRYRDGLYASDLLAAAVSHLDFFTWLDAHPGATSRDLEAHFEIAARPLDVLLTLLRANDFITTHPPDRHELTPVAREHLVAASPFFLGPYY